MNREERKQKRKEDTQKAIISFVIFLCVVAGIIIAAVTLVNRVLPERTENPADTEVVVTGTEETEVTEPIVPEVNPLEEQAKTFVAGMTLEQKVAQMFMITPDALTGFSGVTAAGDTTKQSYIQYPVGGLIYMSGNLRGTDQTTTMLTNMQAYSQEITGLPIFLGVEEEGGTVAAIASNMEYGIADVGDMSDIGASGDPQNAYAVGTALGGYLSGLGFNVDFAPVADVWATPENTVIQYRSFGADSTLVSQMVTSELQGLQENRVYGVVKHFPGYGSTAATSHDGVASTAKTLEEMIASDLVPFQTAINNGASFIMVGHIAVPNITGNDVPSSLSEYMVTELLRNQMGYNGVVVTDAMNISAITDAYSSADAALLAVQAGADIILMPADFASAYQALIDAVNNGTISMERIDESVVRIVMVKQQMAQ